MFPKFWVKLLYALSGLWGLVNNAGWATFGEVEWVSMENYKKAMDVNLNGAILGQFSQHNSQ